MQPLISILLPTYNSSKYICEAIESLLRQTFKNFELIIINDASTDDTSHILDAYRNKDSRVIVIKNNLNLKIARSLNKGLQICRSNIIARMDADDWSYPHRLEVQYKYMKEHPYVTVCGSNIEEYETGRKWKVLTENDQIRAELIFKTSLYHPTVMYKKDLILKYCKGYREDMPPVEDYDLWIRLSNISDVVFSNIPKALLRYRIRNISNIKFDKEKHYLKFNNIRKNLLEKFKVFPSEKEWIFHNYLAGIYRPINIDELYSCGRWAEKLLSANALYKVYPESDFNILIKKHWLDVCRWSSEKIWKSFLIYRNKRLNGNFFNKNYWTCRLFLAYVKCRFNTINFIY